MCSGTNCSKPKNVKKSITKYIRLNTMPHVAGHHKYARLTNQDDLNQQYRLYSDNDDDDNINNGNDDGSDKNEEIELNTGSNVHYQLDNDRTNTKYHNSNGHLNDINYDTNENTKTTISSCNNEQTLNHRLKSSRFMQMALGSLATILLYLTLSIFLTFYQKAIIRELKFPLSIVCYHLIAKLLLASAVRSLYRCYSGKARIQLDWRLSVRKIAPTGLASGVDIGFSNWGLELVPISLYTMTKSSTIVFILIFAILLGLEKKSWSLVFIVSLIAIGLFMFTYKSTQFDALGFIFILVASLSGGIRWSLAQFVMQKSKLGLHNPIDMIYHMQPWMISAVIPFLLTFEGEKLFQVLINLIRANPNMYIVYMNAFKITAGAFLAFCMEVSEFLVLAKTSSLTLSIAGIFKDIFQLALAVELNGDQLTIINVLGLIVCLIGICCHLLHKYSMLSEMMELYNYNENSISAPIMEINFNDNLINSNNGSDNINVDNVANTTTQTVTAASLPITATNNINTATNDSYSSIRFMDTRNYSSQTVPLLNVSDSDDDTVGTGTNGMDKCNSSDVIFDILKRRDVSHR